MPIPKIPTIPSYPMPTPGSLPTPVVDWEVEADRAVLLIHDMQRYFLNPFTAGDSPRAELEANVAALRGWAVSRDVPIIYTAQPGGMSAEERGLLRDFWGWGMRRDDGGRTIPPDLAPRTVDTVLTKWRYSAFHWTGLDDRLRELGRDQLVICGVYANTGCLVTAVDAFSRDLETFLVHDAVADFSESQHRQALEYAAARCAAIPATGDVLNSLDTSGSSDSSDAPAGAVVAPPR